MGILDRLLGPSVAALEARRDLDGLLRVLAEGRREELRAEAAGALARLGDDRALPALANALGAGGAAGTAAAAALRGAGRRAIGPLVAALGAEQGAAGVALELLLELGEGAVRPLVEALRGGDAAARGRALAGVGRLWPGLAADGDARDTVVRGLLAALGDREPTIRAGAASMLEAMREPRAARALAACLKDGDGAARAAASAALLAIGEAAVPHLLGALADRSPRARGSAVRLLGEVTERLDDGGLRAEVAVALAARRDDRDPEVAAAAAGVVARLGLVVEDAGGDGIPGVEPGAG